MADKPDPADKPKPADKSIPTTIRLSDAVIFFKKPEDVRPQIPLYEGMPPAEKARAIADWKQRVAQFWKPIEISRREEWTALNNGKPLPSIALKDKAEFKDTLHNFVPVVWDNTEIGSANTEDNYPVTFALDAPNTPVNIAGGVVSIHGTDGKKAFEMNYANITKYLNLKIYPHRVCAEICIDDSPPKSLQIGLVVSVENISDSRVTIGPKAGYTDLSMNEPWNTRKGGGKSIVRIPVFANERVGMDHLGNGNSIYWFPRDVKVTLASPEATIFELYDPKNPKRTYNITFNNGMGKPVDESVIDLHGEKLSSQAAQEFIKNAEHYKSELLKSYAKNVEKIEEPGLLADFLGKLKKLFPKPKPIPLADARQELHFHSEPEIIRPDVPYAAEKRISQRS